jgi:uncharacterized protein (DUF2384 family)
LIKFQKESMTTATFPTNPINQLFGLNRNAIREAILRQSLPERPLEDVVNYLCQQFGINQTAALNLIDVSPSQKSRGKNADLEVIDRAITSLETFARVASKMGEPNARRWFVQTNPNLSDLTPLQCLKTRVGLQQLEEHIAALEDGAYL